MEERLDGSPAMVPRRTVVVIDDEPMLVSLAEKFFSRSGIPARGFSSPQSALAWYHQNHSEVGMVLMDLRMPGMSGEGCLKALRQIDSEPRVVVLSGNFDQDVVEELRREGAYHFFQKPLEYPHLIRWVSSQLMQ